MSSFVIINGKKYYSNSAHDVFEKNYDEELDNHFNNTQDSIDAKWTAHIAKINEEIKNAGPYKPGRPTKNQENVPQLGA